MSKLILFLSLLVAPVLWSGASATLIGDEVELWCSHDAGPFGNCEGDSPELAIVGAGTEFDFWNNGNGLLDVDANSFTISFTGTFCGWYTCNGTDYMHLLLADLDWIDMPTGYITGIVVTHNLLDGSILSSFGPDSVSLSLLEQGVDTSNFIHVELITTHIPAPGALLLSLLGLIGLYRYKR